jgi:hypothetical protein
MLNNYYISFIKNSKKIKKHRGRGCHKQGLKQYVFLVEYYQQLTIDRKKAFVSSVTFAISGGN